jgi:hypothetical protein
MSHSIEGMFSLYTYMNARKVARKPLSTYPWSYALTLTHLFTEKYRNRIVSDIIGI